MLVYLINAGSLVNHTKSKGVDYIESVRETRKNLAENDSGSRSDTNNKDEKLCENSSKRDILSV